MRGEGGGRGTGSEVGSITPLLGEGVVLLGRLHDLAQGQSTSGLFIVLYEFETFGPTIDFILDSSNCRIFTVQI